MRLLSWSTTTARFSRKSIATALGPITVAAAACSPPSPRTSRTFGFGQALARTSRGTYVIHNGHRVARRIDGHERARLEIVIERGWVNAHLHQRLVERSGIHDRNVVLQAVCDQKQLVHRIENDARRKLEIKRSARQWHCFPCSRNPHYLSAPEWCSCLRRWSLPLNSTSGQPQRPSDFDQWWR